MRTYKEIVKNYIYWKIHNYIQKDLYLMRKKAFNHIRKDAIESFFHIM